MKEKHKSAIWKLAQTDAEKAMVLKTALCQVLDPEMDISVIDLGLIRDAEQIENMLLIKMILTSPFCPFAAQLIESVEQSAAFALKMAVQVDLQMEPWDASYMEDGFDLDWGLF